MKKIIHLCFLCLFLIFLTGCVECTLSLNYSKPSCPQLETNLYIEQSILKKYHMSLSDLKKQITSNELFDDWTITDLKKDSYVGLKLKAPSSFIKQTTSFKKKNELYDLTIAIDSSFLDISELNHYKKTLQLLDKSSALCQIQIIMPGTITYSNYGKYLNDTVTINLFDLLINQKELSFHIVSKDNHQQIYLYLITFFLLGCLIIFCIIYKNR